MGQRGAGRRLVLLTVLAATACGDNLGASDGNDGPIDAALTPPPDAPPTPDAPLGELVLSPASLALSVDIPGPAVTGAFTLTLGGVDVTADATWTIARPALGSVAEGTVTTGLRGGRTTVTARIGELEASATLEVSLHVTIDDEGLAGLFDAPPAGPDTALNLLYPSDGVLMPRNVRAPEVQWVGVPSGPVRLTWTERYGDITWYLTAPEPGVATLADPYWAGLAETGDGAMSDPIAFSIARPGFEPVTQTWHIAQGDLLGEVVSDAVGVDCPDFGSVAVQRQDLTVAAPIVDAPAVGTCHGCHSTSGDGRRTAYNLDTGLPFPVVVADRSLGGYLAPFAPGTTPAGGTFSAFSPDGNRLILSNDGSFDPSAVTLALWDLNAGSVLNADLLGAGCGEPAWSPDGSQVAAICDLGGGGWVFDASAGTLVTATWDPLDDTVLGPRVNVAPTVAASGGRPTYPSFTSDSAWLAFAATDMGSRSTGGGRLWLAPADGSDAPVELVAASGGDPAFYPAWAPVRAGGYRWIAFTRRGDYGHLAVDRKQIWIAAVDDDLEAAVAAVADPSYPAFYLRDQRACVSALSVKFARTACADEAASCDTGLDCCGGSCVDGTCGVDPGACVADGNACGTAEDCCTADATCTDGYCAAPFPE
jgi:hypothetical protein